VVEGDVGVLLRGYVRDRAQDDPRRLRHFGRRAEEKARPAGGGGRLLEGMAVGVLSKLAIWPSQMREHP
jgi:hypothetical protein